MIKEYLNNIAMTTSQGDAREESYYGHLSSFLKSFADSIGKSQTKITTIPKKTEAGNPDFRIWDGKYHITGYIEAKKPGENLDSIETSEQIKRYKTTFPNLILTDFYEFRLYRDSKLIDKVSIGSPFLPEKLKIAPPLEYQERFYRLLEGFFSFSLPKVFTAENLAVELAKRTRFLRDEVVSKELEQEESQKGELYGFYEAFKKYLVATLSQKEFADIYSQTITYGMFTARTKATNGFSRQSTYYLIPPTIGILKDLFRFISLGKLPIQMEVIIDDIAEVLHVSDVSSILNEYYKQGKGEDPIVHFYETFLNVYDPATREKRGVYYTPEPVVKYIVNSVHEILKLHFDSPDGLASKDVILLDPAGGTLTFLAEAIKVAVKEYIDKYGQGGVRDFINKHILKNYYAFELMMAAYAIGHFKISFLLETFGFTLADDDRFNLYLTNTLDMEDLEQTQIPGLHSLSEESHQATKVKKQVPILVIIGNPPYSGISANMNKWTERLLKEDIDGAKNYYEIDGKPLKERNSKWLQDDYVKFIRFAQWKIHKAGQGIVGMITNHSYLDNPTFRGMRQSLIDTFNEIYILDLHGNALKKETTTDGNKDENVFDIKQGVAISLFIKMKDKKGCRVYHYDILGLKDKKYKWLNSNVLKKKNYHKIKPKSPWYLFIPKDYQNNQGYEQYLKINEIFSINNVGIVTAKDHFVIDVTIDKLKNRIRQFRDLKIDDLFIREAYKLKDSENFNLKISRLELSKIHNWKDYIMPINYRPFDIRWIFYSKWLVERQRYDVMRHLIKIENNIAININRQVKTLSHGWCHVFVSNILTESCYISNRTSEICYVYPLYVIPENSNGGNGDLFNPPKKTPDSNINPEVYEVLKGNYGELLSPEYIFYYIYAVLYCNVYRKKYEELLRIDFPRIPFTANIDLFKKMSKLGESLADLHLLKHPSLNNPISKYEGLSNDNIISKPTYEESQNRVYINKEKYFVNITPEIWQYHIGGYQVMAKYLKDRKGNTMDEPEQYCKIATAILETINIQKEIDDIFEEVDKDVIEFN